MHESAKLAIAAHLHVLLRRKTGRVTDTEWLAKNAEYAAEIVRFARAEAVSMKVPELAEWAAKLEQALQAKAPSPAPVGLRGNAVADAAVSQVAEDSERRQPDEPRYVGGIR